MAVYSEGRNPRWLARLVREGTEASKHEGRTKRGHRLMFVEIIIIGHSSIQANKGQKGWDCQCHDQHQARVVIVLEQSKLTPSILPPPLSETRVCPPRERRMKTHEEPRCCLITKMGA